MFISTCFKSPRLTRWAPPLGQIQQQNIFSNEARDSVLRPRCTAPDETRISTLCMSSNGTNPPIRRAKRAHNKIHITNVRPDAQLHCSCPQQLPIRCATSRVQSKTHEQVNKNSSAHQSRNSTCSGRDTSHSVALTMCVCCVVCKRETMYVCVCVSCGLRVSRGVRAFSCLRVSRDVCVKNLSAGVRVLSFGDHHDVSVFFAARLTSCSGDKILPLPRVGRPCLRLSCTKNIEGYPATRTATRKSAMKKDAAWASPSELVSPSLLPPRAASTLEDPASFSCVTTYFKVWNYFALMVRREV